MTHIVAPQPIQAIVDKLGVMSLRFRTWTQQVTRLEPLRGTGSPEGIMPGFEDQFYVDDAGVAGAILYIKRDADIAGDRTLGWILV